MLLPSSQDIVAQNLKVPLNDFSNRKDIGKFGEGTLYWLSDEAFLEHIDYKTLIVSEYNWGTAFAKQNKGWTCGFSCYATLMRTRNSLTGDDENRDSDRSKSYSERSVLRKTNADYPLNLTKCGESFYGISSNSTQDDGSSNNKIFRPGDPDFPSSLKDLYKLFSTQIKTFGGVMVNLRPKNYLIHKDGGWGHWVLLIAVTEIIVDFENLAHPENRVYFAGILDPSEGHPGGYSNFLNNRLDVQLNQLSLKIHFKMLNCSKYAIINYLFNETIIEPKRVLVETKKFVRCDGDS